MTELQALASIWPILVAVFLAITTGAWFKFQLLAFETRMKAIETKFAEHVEKDTEMTRHIAEVLARLETKLELRPCMMGKDCQD